MAPKPRFKFRPVPTMVLFLLRLNYNQITLAMNGQDNCSALGSFCSPFSACYSFSLSLSLLVSVSTRKESGRDFLVGSGSRHRQFAAFLLGFTSSEITPAKLVQQKAPSTLSSCFLHFRVKRRQRGRQSSGGLFGG
ncbi:hypothetical protein NMG60_11018982 [Bertholletia excelsa]